jgi:hypothetical protein
VAALFLSARTPLNFLPPTGLLTVMTILQGRLCQKEVRTLLNVPVQGHDLDLVERDPRNQTGPGGAFHGGMISKPIRQIPGAIGAAGDCLRRGAER